MYIVISASMVFTSCLIWMWIALYLLMGEAVTIEFLLAMAVAGFLVIGGIIGIRFIADVY